MVGHEGVDGLFQMRTKLHSTSWSTSGLDEKYKAITTVTGSTPDTDEIVDIQLVLCYSSGAQQVNSNDRNYTSPLHLDATMYEISYYALCRPSDWCSPDQINEDLLELWRVVPLRFEVNACQLLCHLR